MEEVAEKKCNDAFDYIQRNTGPFHSEFLIYLNINALFRLALDIDELNLKRR